MYTVHILKPVFTLSLQSESSNIIYIYYVYVCVFMCILVRYVMDINNHVSLINISYNI